MAEVFRADWQEKENKEALSVHCIADVFIVERGCVYDQNLVLFMGKCSFSYVKNVWVFFFFCYFWATYLFEP